jgi:2-methylisocitrate lyase-like PEP mutase family enzyme
MTIHPTLKDQLSGSDIAIAPGVFNALGAVLAEQAGFHAAYLSGASIAYTRFGRPDIGLVGMSEVAETLSVITERSDLRIVVDADTGFGNSINVMRTVRLFESAGAAAIQLEDQTLPKRCGHLAGKTLVSAPEMVGKIKAALDARRSDATLIIARTDAIAVEGFEAALARAGRYVAAGADLLFIEAPQSIAQMQEIVARFGARLPLMANIVEGGLTPQQTATELKKLGFSLAIFPGGMVRAIAKTMRDYLASLKSHGTNAPFHDRMLDFDGLNDLLGTDDILALGASYDAAIFEDSND